MQPCSIEVTVAHELIHLADRVNGTPRRHRHHGYDSIAADEAAVTGYSLEELRRFLTKRASAVMLGGGHHGLFVISTSAPAVARSIRVLAAIHRRSRVAVVIRVIIRTSGCA